MKNQHKCPVCLSTNIIGMSRIVGYYSIINNWNESKQAELIDRQAGNYNIQQEKIMVTI